jgi:hypothetical protein
MKNNIRIRNVIRVGVGCVLALLLSALVLAPRAADKPATAAPGQLARDMMGTWVLVGKPGKVREAPESGGRLKFRTGKHWTMTQSDPRTGLVVMHDGGTYSLDGDTYTETLEYANESTSNDIGRTFVFKVKVEGDLMTQEGVGNPYTEVWKRLK